MNLACSSDRKVTMGPETGWEKKSLIKVCPEKKRATKGLAGHGHALAFYLSPTRSRCIVWAWGQLSFNLYSKTSKEVSGMVRPEDDESLDEEGFNLISESQSRAPQRAMCCPGGGEPCPVQQGDQGNCGTDRSPCRGGARAAETGWPSLLCSKALAAIQAGRPADRVGGLCEKQERCTHTSPR